MTEELNPPSESPPEGAPEWMVTFSDMMSLLLTFFIMLVSMSNTDVMKYRQVVESLNGAFGASTEESAQFEKSSAPVTAHDIRDENQALQELAQKLAELAKESRIQDHLSMAYHKDQITISGKKAAQLKANRASQLISNLNAIIQNENMENMVKVVMDPRGVAVRIDNISIYNSGSAEIKKESFRVLYKIGQVINQFEGHILIEGHTDDRPIHSRQFPSNWELSSARSSSAARFFMKYTKTPKNKLSVIGSADTKPLAPNDNDNNRAANRRVEFIFVQSPVE